MATKKPTAAAKVTDQVDFSAIITTLEKLKADMDYTAEQLGDKASILRDQSDALEAAAYDISSAIDALTGIEVD